MRRAAGGRGAVRAVQLQAEHGGSVMDWDLKTILAGVGVAWAVLSTALLGWLSKSFAAKGKVDELAREVETAKSSLAAGEARFVKLEAAIRSVQRAAEEAKEAAEKAEKAADQVHSVEVDIAELNGAIEALKATLKPIEHFNRLMVEGHMKLGRD